MSGRVIITMREALESPAYFGTPDLLGGDSWMAWRVVLIATMGERLTVEERIVFERLTGRPAEPGERVEELWGIVGRRGGKSRAIAALTVYLACFVDYRHVLAPGQYGQVPVIAASREQANEIFNYATGMIGAVASLAVMLAGAPTAHKITLKSRVEISIRTASFRTTRGFTAVAVVLDEAAFFHSEHSANPDSEIIKAVKFALATTQGILAVISSPYARRGEVWTAYRKHYGAEGDPKVLVVKAASKDMNPTISASYIAREYEKDAVAAAAELGGEFRNDIDAFVSEDVIRACVDHGRREIAYHDGMSAFAFVDAAGGGGSDSFAGAVAFRDKDKTVLACVFERKPPFSPAKVTEDFCDILARYKITRVTGDKWAKGYVSQEFARHKIAYVESELTASDCYREFLPIVTSGQAVLLDHEKMIVQFAALERTPSTSGRDIIRHPPNGHDDVINAVAGAVVHASKYKPMKISADMVARSRQPLNRPSFGGMMPSAFNPFARY